MSNGLPGAINPGTDNRARNVKLFDDQEAVLDDLYELIEAGKKKIVLQAATGAGKTVMAAHMMRDAYEGGSRILFLVHLDQLRIQTAKKLEGYGVPESAVCVIGGGFKADMHRPVAVTSVQTLARRRELLTHYKWDAVILDECHITAWAKACDPLFARDSDQLVIGLSATPTRLKKTEGIGDKFTDMVQAPKVAALMDSGRLCRLRYYGFKTGGIDTAGVHTQMGDFKTDELEQVCDRPELLVHAVEQWKRLAAGRRTLAFCVTVQHAESLCNAMNELGVPSATVTGETPREERQEIYRKLEAKELMAVTSVNVLSIGFDSPLGGECLLLCRPSKSLSVHLQQLGRGARSHPDKDFCLVLDQSGNCLKHGPLEADHDWAIREGLEKQEGGGEFPMKICPECGALIMPQFGVCPECGAVQPVREKKIRTDDLQELRFDKEERRRQTQLHRWINRAHQSGYLQGWVLKQYERKFDGHPKTEDWLGAIYGPDPSPLAPPELAQHWAYVCARKNRGWPVALSALTREFGADRIEPITKELRMVWETARPSAA